MDAELPVTRFAALQRWASTYSPEYAQMTPDGITDPRRSPFPYIADINGKIAYWTGDLSSLDTHAIVACNCENLTDTDPQTVALFERAGPELRHELVNSVKGCRTGEAKITKGYRLPARCVIHTVGPRYNAKYKTAAENALFNCYRNVLMLLRENNLMSLGLRCVHSTRRGYPSMDGAHIGLRTVRRFLERYGSDIDIIVFVVTGSDRESYASLLPLYFPRSAQEEAYAARRLPLDVGNENGEPVIAERQIRIAANPSSSGGDAETGRTDSDDSDDDPSMTDILGTTGCVGEHAFARMEADVDKQRRQRCCAPELMDAAEQHRLNYERLLKRSRQENLLDIISCRFLYQSGFSRTGEPVVVFIGKNLPSSLALSDKVLLYMIQQLDSVVNSKYLLVYVHTLADASNQTSAATLKRLFDVADSRYRRNLQALYMLHTSLWSKMSFWWWSMFDATDIKSKIEHLPGLEYLFARVTPDQLDLPDFVLKYDYEVYGIRYYTCPDSDL